MTVKEHATINPTTIRNEVENCKEDVILGILWNTGGGHIVTVNSIANFADLGRRYYRVMKDYEPK